MASSALPGEFGAPAIAEGAIDYIRLLYDLPDGGQVGAPPFSGAQWVYSTGWTPDKFDGWDTENFSIVDNKGPRTQLFVPRAYALRVASRIAIELDGGQHFGDADAYRRDRRKDALLQENGFLVLRFLAEDVGKYLDQVLDAILRALSHQQASR